MLWNTHGIPELKHLFINESEPGCNTEHCNVLISREFSVAIVSHQPREFGVFYRTIILAAMFYGIYNGCKTGLDKSTHVLTF